MSAGRGVSHSEFNHSNQEELHLLQIWILPDKKGLEPGYEQKTISKQVDRLILIGSPDKTKQSVTIHQNLNLYAGYFNQGARLSYALHGHQGWLQLIKGRIACNGQTIHPGDGVAIQQEQQIMLESVDNAELLFFEML